MADDIEVAYSPPLGPIDVLATPAAQSPTLGPEKDLYRSRQVIAFIFVGLFAATVIIGLITVWFPTSATTKYKDLIPILMSAQTGLLGSVVGFYFGSTSASSQS